MATINIRPCIAIDTIFFNMSYSGISRVWEGILSNLEISNLEVEIILLIRGKEIPKNILKSGFHLRFSKSQILHINDFSYPTMQQDVDYLNQLAIQYKWDYFLSTYFTYCTTIPNILLINDMIPEKFGLAKNHMWIQKDLAIRNASQFICISETTKNDLIMIYPYLAIENYPITVIKCSIPLENKSTKIATSADSDQFYQNVFINNGILPKKYILTISTNQEAYKNQILIKNLIDKYKNQLVARLETPIPLVIITKNIPNPCGVIVNGLLLLSDVSDEGLHLLYKNAAVFINPSLAEGFGLPVFEAFSYQVPVITCNLPVYEELCPGAITYTDNDPDELYQKILYILKGNGTVQRRIEAGTACVSKYTLEKQVSSYRDLFNSLSRNRSAELEKGFLNIIFQSYAESNPARRTELEHCIQANLSHPTVKYIHDFSKDPNIYLPTSITSHPKYIHVPSVASNNGEWLTYENSFKYSSRCDNTKSFGIYWAVINCDIMLAAEPILSKWLLMRGWLNSGYILAQSRHEYDPLTNTAKIDANFAKLMHSNTQDAWFYSVGSRIEIRDCDFQIGMLGCDNAIAHRILSSGYKIINMPKSFPIWHYDIARGKTSSNYLEKHAQTTTDKNTNSLKPKNSHPERCGQSLVPNYDSMMDAGGGSNIDVIALINQMGGISNWEKYKLIAEMMSSRIMIYNP
jgi:glycosyltransferase involved in cell wall biosynthesis